MKAEISIKTAWYGMILWITFAPLIILFPWSGFKAREILLESALNKENHLNQEIENQLDIRVSRLLSMLQNRAIVIDLLKEREKIKAFVDTTVSGEDEINKMMVLSPEGSLFVRSGHKSYLDNPLIGDSNSPVYLVPLHGRTYIGPVLTDHQMPEFQIAVPIGASSKPFGVLIAFINIENLLRHVQSQLIRPETTTYIVDNYGNLLYSNRKTMYSLGTSLTHLAVVRTFLINQEWSKSENYIGLTGKPVYGTMTSLDMLNWGLITEVPEQTITGPIFKGLGLIGMVHFLIVAFFGGAGLLLVKRIIQPVSDLTMAVDKIREGDFVKIESTTKIRELRKLMNDFNKMVSVRKGAEETIRHMAYYDSLTGLPNRALLQDRLQQAILLETREKKSLALLFMDLDRFKEINDTLGHHNGDILLQQAGDRLRNVLRESDTAARMGGDEFAVLLPATDLEGAILTVKKILESVEQPFGLNEMNLEVSLSIGIAMFPEHGVDSHLLIQRADMAMYEAKKSGSGFAVYSSGRDLNTISRLTRPSELRHAIGDQLFLLYQPKINLRTGLVSGAEALVRWKHPQQGIIPPDQFIPLAEQTGLIKLLTLWVLQTALTQLRQWHQEGLKISIAVNLSARNLQDPELPGEIEKIIQECGVSSQWLEFEITESVIMADPKSSLETLTRLKMMGVQLSIDDFGTGYSSLGYLKKLPVDSIKIDQSFVKDMLVNEDDRVIVRSMIDLGHNLGLYIIAEGVEKEEILITLSALGSDFAQGYYMSRPLSPFEFREWVSQSRWGLKILLEDSPSEKD